jgi:CRP-like cAMP-binding protein
MAGYSLKQMEITHQIENEEKKSQQKKENKEEILFTINKGEFFGVEEFFSGEERKFTTKTLEFCSVLSIDRNNFMQICQNLNQFEY